MARGIELEVLSGPLLAASVGYGAVACGYGEGYLPDYDVLYSKYDY